MHTYTCICSCISTYIYTHFFILSRALRQRDHLSCSTSLLDADLVNFYNAKLKHFTIYLSVLHMAYIHNSCSKRNRDHTCAIIMWDGLGWCTTPSVGDGGLRVSNATPGYPGRP